MTVETYQSTVSVNKTSQAWTPSQKQEILMPGDLNSPLMPGREPVGVGSATRPL